MHDEGKIVAEQRFYGRAKEQSRPVRHSKKNEQANSSWFLKLSLTILFICVLIWGWSRLMNPQIFPIHKVQIDGEYHNVDHSVLRETILPYVQKGFWGVDLTGLKDRLLQVPWVGEVDVQRKWPDSLTIQLLEQKPIARFGENVLLNTRGELFGVAAATIPAGLPSFAGPAGQQKLMIQVYQQMSALLAPLGLRISSLVLDLRQSWQVQLENGLVIYVGRVDPLQRIQRFVAIYKQALETKVATVQSVDLRYANGVAVRFKG